MKALGSQIIAEFIHCQTDVLNHKEDLEKLLREGIERCDLQLKSINAYQFEPVGVTAIAIIGESHIAMHTYPEAQHLSLDIFTCSPGSKKPHHLMRFLKDQLKPELVRYKEFNRGQSIECVEHDYITDLSKNSFDIRYQINAEILNKRTDYQHMIIIDNHDFGHMLFLDHELQIAETDADLYHAALVDPIINSKCPLNKIAILGGGDGGVLKYALDHGVQKAYLIDIDAEVISAAKTHLQGICGDAFQDPRAEVVIQEAKQFIQKQDQLDAVIYDLTMSPEVVAHDEQETYFPELFQAIHKSLNTHGILTIQVCSAHDFKSLERAKTILEDLFVELTFNKVFIPSFCEEWIFAQAKKA